MLHEVDEVSSTLLLWHHSKPFTTSSPPFSPSCHRKPFVRYDVSEWDCRPVWLSWWLIPVCCPPPHAHSLFLAVYLLFFFFPVRLIWSQHLSRAWRWWLHACRHCLSPQSKRYLGDIMMLMNPCSTSEIFGFSLVCIRKYKEKCLSLKKQTLNKAVPVNTQQTHDNDEKLLFQLHYIPT